MQVQEARVFENSIREELGTAKSVGLGYARTAPDNSFAESPRTIA